MIQPHNITKEELIREIESLRAERDDLLKHKQKQFIFIKEQQDVIYKLKEQIDNLQDPEERWTLARPK